jgi:hypothetical protein
MRSHVDQQLPGSQLPRVVPRVWRVARGALGSHAQRAHGRADNVGQLLPPSAGSRQPRQLQQRLRAVLRRSHVAHERGQRSVRRALECLAPKQRAAQAVKKGGLVAAAAAAAARAAAALARAAAGTQRELRARAGAADDQVGEHAEGLVEGGGAARGVAPGGAAAVRVRPTRQQLRRKHVAPQPAHGVDRARRHQRVAHTRARTFVCVCATTGDTAAAAVTTSNSTTTESSSSATTTAVVREVLEQGEAHGEALVERVGCGCSGCRRVASGAVHRRCHWCVCCAAAACAGGGGPAARG